jgi:membrane protein YqaA with SNARE-associated domain
MTDYMKLFVLVAVTSFVGTTIGTILGWKIGEWLGKRFPR